MMNPQRTGIGLTALAVLTFTAAPRAFAKELKSLSGVWAAKETKEEAKAREAAIKKAIQSVPFFARGKAKDRLRERTKAPQTVRVELLEDGRVRLTTGDKKLELTVGGAPLEREKDGKKVKISAQDYQGRLVINSVGKDAKRVATYRVTENGSLQLAVKMIGGPLKTPLSYVQTFMRLK